MNGSVNDLDVEQDEELKNNFNLNDTIESNDFTLKNNV